MARKSQPTTALGKELSRQNILCKGLRPGKWRDKQPPRHGGLSEKMA